LPIPDNIRLFAERLRPAMALKCMPLRVATFPAGTAVGYGGTWVAQRESVVATLPVGYGDGFARAYQPGGQALVRGRRVPLVGTVAMDAVMADVTEIEGVTTDDEFVLLGDQGDESITANELARLRNTIPWEVVTGMSFRLPRVYHAASVLKGLRTLAGEVRASGE
jgi:alanine racemase